MKTRLRLEEGAQFLFCLAVLIMNDVPWWAYPILVLGPDIGMLGYMVNTRTGAFTYNLLHHKGIAVIVYAIGVYINLETLFDVASNTGNLVTLAGVILFGHSSMDRALGYGLKYGDDFKHTHLGWIGRAQPGQPSSQ